VSNGRLPGTSTYFRGQGQRVARAATFARTGWKDAWRGIDVAFYGFAGRLEYDVDVAPLADPGRIAFRFSAPRAASLRRDGSIALEVGGRTVRELPPIAYQFRRGVRRRVRCRYILERGGVVRIGLAAYDRRLPLVIDPKFDYSTYLGGSGLDWGAAIAVDSTGSAYVTGTTMSSDFPVRSALKGSNAGHNDAFVTKLSADGRSVEYSTYLGGAGNDQGLSIAVDGAGSAYICGTTTSSDFPVSAQAFQRAFASGSTGGYGPDGFVTKLTANGGSLAYSTYFGGSAGDLAEGVAVDRDGNAYVAGTTLSVDFPTANSIQGRKAGDQYDSDAFIAKLNHEGSGLFYSSYLGGRRPDEAKGLAVGRDGSAYVTGLSYSQDFPLVNESRSSPSAQGVPNAFLTSLSPDGRSYRYSTYLGGTGGDVAAAVAVDASGRAYVTGQTSSSDFPTKNAAQPSPAGSFEGFVMRMAADGSLDYSTYLGGTGLDAALAITADPRGRAIVAGKTESADFPARNAVQRAYGGGSSDGFVTELSPDGRSLVFSTFFGGDSADTVFGVAADANGGTYFTGNTGSSNLATPDAFQPNPDGGGDGFIAKLQSETTATTARCSPSNINPGGRSTCTVSVSDIGQSPRPPTGEVGLTTDGHGSFDPTPSCVLTATSERISGCEVVYSPTQVDSGDHEIKATYTGDQAHESSSGATHVTVDERASDTSLATATPPPRSPDQSTQPTATSAGLFITSSKHPFRNGAVRLQLRCAGAPSQRCRGVLKLAPVATRNANGLPTFGHGRFNVAAGHAAGLVVRASAALKRALRRTRRVGVLALAQYTSAGAEIRSASYAFMIRR
jgi:hypothetical protein